MVALPHLSEAFEKDVDEYISAQALKCASRYSEVKLRQKVLYYFEWLRSFSKLHYQSRLLRAQELTTDEVFEARELARQFIGGGSHDFFVTCVDGRNMPTVMFSKPPHVGGVLRAPAGSVTGFMVAQDPNTVFIDTDSYVVQQIIKLLREKAGGTIFYGLDSHLGCAAREQIHATEGGTEKDKGLRSDILSKIMTARGILQLRRQLKEAGEEIAEIIPTFFSYDPRTGGVFAGLELYVNDEAVAKYGFTDEVLKQLTTSGKIVSTLDLIKNDEVRVLLEKEIREKSSDFRNHYAKSLLQNWNTIAKLYDKGNGSVFQAIYQALKNVYSNAGWIIAHSDSFDLKSITDRTIRQKAKFLLKNCVTRYSIAGVDHEWPYDNHQEEMVVITDGGYAPFPAIDAFAVFSRDLNALLPNTKLTIDLIRNSRRGNKIINPVKSSTLTNEDFVAAPVFISNKAILKGVSEDSWETFQKLNVDNLLNQISWDNKSMLEWQRADILSLVNQASQEKELKLTVHDVIAFIDALYELFNRMRIMMRDKYFRQMILQGSVVILNIMVDENRTPKLLVKIVI